MMRKVHAVRRVPGQAAAPTPAKAPARIDVAFGVDGNAAVYLGAGWSGQESGFSWAAGDRSILRLPALQPAGRFYFEIDIVPFVSGLAITGQRLRVRINGREAFSFPKLPREVVSFTIPGELMRRTAPIEIVFEYPDAPSPRQATGGDDDRRLAVAFRSLWVSALTS